MTEIFFFALIIRYNYTLVLFCFNIIQIKYILIELDVFIKQVLIKYSS